LQSAIVGVTGEDGKSIFAGKVATSFSNAEEQEIGFVEVSRSVPSKFGHNNEDFQEIPFLPEDRIKSLGGTYEKADEIWGVSFGFCYFSQRSRLRDYPQVKVVHSGNLFTGQNPASARPLAEKILKTLQGKA
jgi:putative intracellular protease/amidase